MVRLVASPCLCALVVCQGCPTRSDAPHALAWDLLCNESVCAQTLRAARRAAAWHGVPLVPARGAHRATASGPGGGTQKGTLRPALVPHRHHQASEEHSERVLPDFGDVQDNATALAIAGLLTRTAFLKRQLHDQNQKSGGALPLVKTWSQFLSQTENRGLGVS
jgi:hypothetical protein